MCGPNSRRDFTVRNVDGRAGNNFMSESLGRRMTRDAMDSSWKVIREFVQVIAESAGCMVKPVTRFLESDAAIHTPRISSPETNISSARVGIIDLFASD